MYDTSCTSLHSTAAVTISISWNPTSLSGDTKLHWWFHGCPQNGESGKTQKTYPQPTCCLTWASFPAYQLCPWCASAVVFSQRHSLGELRICSSAPDTPLELVNLFGLHISTMCLTKTAALEAVGWILMFTWHSSSTADINMELQQNWYQPV